MKFSLGFSPCPNDTFIFDALVNKKIDTGDLDFEVHLEDVQTLNQWAKEERLDISKVSYGVLPKITAAYWVLNSGGALGKGVGPLLIGKQQADEGWHQIQEQVNASSIAIPGEDTTAHFLFAQAFPYANKKEFLRFNEIEHYVAEGKGPGVIIHENRFTYRQKGLHKWVDLGEYWEASTGNPIPLGGIVMKRSIGAAWAERINNLIRQSVEYAFEHYPEVSAYVRQHAQEMSEAVMRQHIDLYVNDFSLALDESGKAAVLEMMKTLSRKSYEADAVFAIC